MKKNTPTITIVTPSYNQGRFIAETIESVLSQAGDFYIEYIIMDGGSTDNSVEVIRKYDRLLKEGKWPVKCLGITYSWTSAKDKGQSDAINKGFRQATGDYIAWLNSDDTYEPGAIRKAIDYLQAHPDFIMVYGEGYFLYEPSGKKKRYPVEKFDYINLASFCYITQPSVFLRREVLKKVGYLDESLHFCMDYDWWIRIGKICKVGYIPEYLANTRVHPETKTESGRVKHIAEIHETVMKHYGFISDNWKLADISAEVSRYMRYDSLLGMFITVTLFLAARFWETKRIPFKYIKNILRRKAFYGKDFL